MRGEERRGEEGRGGERGEVMRAWECFHDHIYINELDI